jgi:hypothetical protein
VRSFAGDGYRSAVSGLVAQLSHSEGYAGGGGEFGAEWLLDIEDGMLRWACCASPDRVLA